MKYANSPSAPPIRSFLNKLNHANAKTQEGIMYGTTAKAPNTPLYRMLVLTINHASKVPIETPMNVTQIPMSKLFNKGFIRSALESGPAKTRS